MGLSKPRSLHCRGSCELPLSVPKLGLNPLPLGERQLCLEIRINPESSGKLLMNLKVLASSCGGKEAGNLPFPELPRVRSPVCNPWWGIWALLCPHPPPPCDRLCCRKLPPSTSILNTPLHCDLAKPPPRSTVGFTTSLKPGRPEDCL